MLRVGDEEDDICHPITRWEHLPPLPEPKRCEMRMEASGGTVLVLALVAVFGGCYSLGWAFDPPAGQGRLKAAGVLKRGVWR